MPALIGKMANGIRGLDTILLVLTIFPLLVVGGGGLALAIERSAPFGTGLMACAALAAVTPLLWLTAHRWSRGMPGWAGVVALRALPAVITGRSWAAPHPSGLRAVATIVVLYCAVVAWLCARFYDTPPNRQEKVALVLFALTSSTAVFFQRSPFIQATCWMVALTALPLVWLVRALRSTGAGGSNGRRAARQRGANDHD